MVAATSTSTCLVSSVLVARKFSVRPGDDPSPLAVAGDRRVGKGAWHNGRSRNGSTWRLCPRGGGVTDKVGVIGTSADAWAKARFGKIEYVVSSRYARLYPPYAALSAIRPVHQVGFEESLAFGREWRPMFGSKKGGLCSARRWRSKTRIALWPRSYPPYVIETSGGLASLHFRQRAIPCRCQCIWISERQTSFRHQSFSFQILHKCIDRQLGNLQQVPHILDPQFAK